MLHVKIAVAPKSRSFSLLSGHFTLHFLLTRVHYEADLLNQRQGI
jgi:hypothetical protein